MAKQSPLAFWIKHVILGVIVILGAIVVIQYDPSVSEQSIASSAQSPEERDNIRDNLSDFYEEFRISSRDPITELYGDYVIPLETPSESVAQTLIKMGNVSFPPQENWTGEQKVRAFPKDSTLRTEALKYVEEEGLTLIWDLNQDFIIRHRFQSYNTLSGTIDEIRGAVDSNFPQRVLVFLCLRKRALVITAEPQDYLIERCKKLTPDEFYN
ncbi:TcpQ domain-containing protein [Glaciecola sp. KUL10]|uniref:TcpQ domain-containing protein n=1 Tax=Glaciecola sp. (strain KUL10) TaxID=2161813 RepID=UPI000D783DEB|nr:TcpQ domain-containing protein [Glaciecola sp. KUL10]GBL04265.1 hypothetical protein KUL10_15710 [Glaciecola sp. KUL10]